MSNDASQQDAARQPEGDQTNEQATETDWKAAARQWEQRAKANKTAADELAALKDAQKTSEQKAAERLAALEAQVAEAETKVLRATVGSTHGISVEDRDLFLTGSDEATLTAQAKRLAERAAERQRHGNHVPDEGENPQATDERRAFVRQLTGRG